MERTLSDIHMCAHARSSITLAFRGHNRTLRVGGGGLDSLLRGLTRKTRGQNSEMSLNASLTQQIGQVSTQAFCIFLPRKPGSASISKSYR